MYLKSLTKYRAFIILQFLILAIACSLFLYFSYRLYTSTIFIRYTVQKTLQQEIITATQWLNAHLEQGEKQTLFLSELIHTHSLTGMQITQKAEDILKANPLLIQINLKYDSPIQLQKINDSIKTTQSPFPSLSIESQQWSLPSTSEILNKEVIRYQDSSQKVILTYDMGRINKFINEWMSKEIGYSFIIDSQGNYIYHPVEEYITFHKNIFEIAQETFNPSLKLIAEQILYKKHYNFTYTDSYTSQPGWAYSISLSKLNWIFVSLFTEEEIPLNLLTIHKYQFTLLALTIFIIFLLILFYSSSIINRLKRYVTRAIGFTVTFAVGILFLSYFAHNYTQEQENPVKMLTKPKTIENFLHKYDEENKNLHTIKIPTGIYIYSLFMTAPQRIFFTGYIWQKYNKNDKTISRGFRLPQAIKVESQISYRTSEEDIEIIGWQVKAELYQQFDYSHYPFDVRTVSIVIEHPDLTKYILLIPDIKAYDRLSPSAIPGVDVALYLSGFTFFNSYFSFQPYLPDTNFGIKNYKQETTTNERLSFNISLRRGLLNAFIMYYLPFIVILISMFAVACLIEKYKRHAETRAFSSIASYTALFFSMILIHSTLRNEFRVGEVLYIEYLFFLTYVTLLFLQLYALLTSLRDGKQKDHTPYVELFYWPLILSMWFIITFYLFY